MPIVPATQEAEAGELLEPRRQRLQRAEIVPLHSSLDDRARFHLKKQKRKKEWTWVGLVCVLGGREDEPAGLESLPKNQCLVGSLSSLGKAGM